MILLKIKNIFIFDKGLTDDFIWENNGKWV